MSAVSTYTPRKVVVTSFNVAHSIIYTAGSDLTSLPASLFFPPSTDGGGGFGKVCRVLKLYSHYSLNKLLFNYFESICKYHSLYILSIDVLSIKAWRVEILRGF